VKACQYRHFPRPILEEHVNGTPLFVRKPGILTAYKFRDRGDQARHSAYPVDVLGGFTSINGFG
jgi:hypothetical protein